MMKRIAALILLTLATVSVGRVPDVTIATADRKFNGSVHYRRSQQCYIVISRGRDYVIPLRYVKSITVNRPEELDRAIDLIAEQNYTEAVSMLEDIARRFAMLDWDLEAYRLLIQSYEQMKEPDKIINVYQRASSSTRTGPDDDLTMAYLSALLDLDEYERAQTEADMKLSEQGKARFRVMLRQKESTTKSTISSEAAPIASPPER